MNNEKIYANRRNKLFNELDEAIAIIPSNELVTRSNDTEHPFRQNSNFYYFTGFLETNSVLVLVKKNNERKTILFLEEKIAEMELWTGKRLGPKEAVNTMMIDEAYPITQFKTIMTELIPGSKRLFMNTFDLNKTSTAVLKLTNQLWKSRKKSTFLPTATHHLDYITDAMRLVKEPYEIELMKEAARKTAIGHKVAMAKSAPGVNERDIHAVMDYTFKMNLGDGPAYGMIVASGDNANILHYIENNSPLKDGDLILIDAGAEHKLYASDVTRTFPVNGKFSEIQAKVYNEVLKAQELAISSAVPGITLSKIHAIASLSLTQSLVSLGVLKGDPKELYKNDAQKKYYPHGTGHWLGLDVHDQCPYLDDKCNDIELRENMVFTIEPGLYFPQDDTSIPKELRGIGIRIEDDILMTATGNKNLTEDIPKTVEKIEQQCSEDFLKILGNAIK
jgi:Xaa-Pro aminopeptidase